MPVQISTLTETKRTQPTLVRLFANLNHCNFPLKTLKEQDSNTHNTPLRPRARAQAQAAIVRRVSSVIHVHLYIHCAYLFSRMNPQVFGKCRRITESLLTHSTSIRSLTRMSTHMSGH